VRTHAGATLRSHIDAESYRKIKQLGAKKGCTLFATLLAGFNALLHRLSNQNDIVVGIPAAGQSLLEEGSLIGHCVNFLPLRVQIGEKESFVELLNQVKRSLLDAYDHQTYTYGTLLRKLGVPRDPVRMPLMEVQFNVERLGASAEFRGLKAEVGPNSKAAVILDIFFNVIESDQGLMIDCDYNTDLFDEKTISLWVQYYQTLLLDAVSDADKAVDDLNASVDSTGNLLGEEVIRILDTSKKTSSDVRLWAGEKTITCPGRTRTNTGREGAPGTYVDGEPVNIRVGLLTIGTTALATVNAEVYTQIALRLKKESPIANTVIVTQSNGRANSGYIPTDEAFGHNTFQVLDTHLKPGCAESGIVNAALDLMTESSK